MDPVDLGIARHLLRNCRATYRDLGSQVGLSVNATFKRVQALVENGIILEFTARPSLESLGGLEILAFGSTTRTDIIPLSQDLGAREQVWFVGHAAGNHLLVNGELPNEEKVPDFTRFVTRVARMENPTIGIVHKPYRPTSEALDDKDYQILRALHGDARRSLPDVAEVTKLSTRVVRCKVDRMVDHHLVDFSIQFAPRDEGTIVSNFHLRVPPDWNVDKTLSRLECEYRDSLLYLQRFSNLPHFLMLTTLTQSNQAAFGLQGRLQSEGFTRVEHHIIYHGIFFETWRDRLFRERIQL